MPTPESPSVPAPSAPPPAAASPRMFEASRSGPSALRVVGTSRPGWEEAYYFLLAAPWWKVLGVIAVFWVVVNAIFALGFLAAGGVENARPGSYFDAFFFSVETMATIGYGNMYPRGLGAHLLVTGESLFGILVAAALTGLTFAKIARPRARVMFSRHAVIAMREGVPTLLLRVANERRNHIAEAQIRVSILRNEVTKEGERVRRVIDLPLVRSTQPSFILTWTVMHPITPASPLHGVTLEDLRRADVQILATLVGLDEILVSTIHARYAWLTDELVWNKRHSDVIRADDQGRYLDYSRFHELDDLPPGATLV